MRQWIMTVFGSALQSGSEGVHCNGNSTDKDSYDIDLELMMMMIGTILLVSLQ